MVWLVTSEGGDDVNKVNEWRASSESGWCDPVTSGFDVMGHLLTGAVLLNLPQHTPTAHLVDFNYSSGG